VRDRERREASSIGFLVHLSKKSYSSESREPVESESEKVKWSALFPIPVEFAGKDFKGAADET